MNLTSDTSPTIPEWAWQDLYDAERVWRNAGPGAHETALWELVDEARRVVLSDFGRSASVEPPSPSRLTADEHESLRDRFMV